MTPHENAPVACSLASRELAERRESLRLGLLQRAEAVREIPGGYAVRFAWSQERIREIGDFIAFESECCSFLSFRLDVEPSKGSLWLHVSGSADAEGMVREELRRLLPPTAMPPAASSLAVGTTSTPRSEPGRALIGSGVAFAIAGGAGVVVCCAAPLVAAFGLGAWTAGWLASAEIAAAGLAGLGLALMASGILQRRRRRRIEPCSC